MTTDPNPGEGASARTIGAKRVRAREDPDTRPCPRCRDLIPGGPDGWARHAAGLDSADPAGVSGYAAALAEHRLRSDSTTSSSYVERASRARY